MGLPLTFLEALIYGYRQIMSRGTNVSLRATLNFLAPLKATDDSVNARTKIEIDTASLTGSGVVPTTTATTVLTANAGGTPVWSATPTFTSITVTNIDMSGYMESGADPATAGTYRWSIGDYIAGKGATGEAKLVEWATGDDLKIGSNDTDLDDLYLQVPTGQKILLSVAGATNTWLTGTQFSINQEVISNTGFYTTGYITQEGGTLPASAGTFRISSAWTLQAMDAAEAGEVKVLQWTAADKIQVGDNDADLEGVEIHAPTGKTIDLQIAGASVLAIGSELTAAQALNMGTNPVKLGATVASAGDVRVKSGFVLAGRDAANGGDVDVLTWTAGDEVQLGANDADCEGVDILAPTGKTVDIAVAGATQLSATDTSVTIGKSVIFTPGGDYNITAAGGISAAQCRNVIVRVAGDGGAIDITANPQIAAGTDGQIIIVQGTSDANTVQLDPGTGLDLTAAIILGQNDNITLMYDAGETAWIEVARSAIP